MVKINGVIVGSLNEKQGGAEMLAQEVFRWAFCEPKGKLDVVIIGEIDGRVCRLLLQLGEIDDGLVNSMPRTGKSMVEVARWL